MKREKKIPTILGLLLLTLSTFAGAILTGQNTNFRSKASGDCQPVNPQITNITFSSADVSFTTIADCSAILNVDSQLVNDLYNQTQVHYFQVNNLKENSEYRFFFINNGVTFSKDGYKIKTAVKPPGQIPTSNIAWGKVYNPDHTPATDAIVYLNIPQASPLSAIVTSSGNWNISLALSFNDTRNNWFSPPESIAEDIVVISKSNQVTQVTGNTSQNNPVPDIIIGKDSLSPNQNQTGDINLPTITSAPGISRIDILNPQDGETIFTPRPDFFGRGPINSELIIKLESPLSQDDQIITKQDGSWHWSPPQDLTPGEHTVTISYQNPLSGSWEIVKRRFTVSAKDTNNLAYSASPSGTRVTPSPVSTSTPIPTVYTPVPTNTPSPTIIPTNTVKPTATTVPRSSKPSTSSGLPTPGLPAFTFIPVILAIITIIIGLIFIT